MNAIDVLSIHLSEITKKWTWYVAWAFGAIMAAIACREGMPVWASICWGLAAPFLYLISTLFYGLFFFYSIRPDKEDDDRH